MKISEIVKIVKPKYKFYKLTPATSIRNNDTYKIARVIANLHKSIIRKVSVDEKRLIKALGKEFLIGTRYTINANEKVSYFIYIEKRVVDFYFIIPEQYETIIKEKIKDAWKSVTIKEVHELPKFSPKATKYILEYAKEDALSLRTDRRDNDLLRSKLNLINVLDEGDKIGIFYNFIPTNQKSWRYEYNHTIEKAKNREPIDRNKGKISVLLKYILLGITSLVDYILTVFQDSEKDGEKPFEKLINNLSGRVEFSNSTLRKENSIILDTQILLISESKEKLKQINNIKSLSSSFETISEDNKLIPKRFNKEIDYLRYKLPAPVNKMSDMECQNFISLAGRELLEEYDFIEQVRTNETLVPEELQKGVMCIGENVFRGNKQKAYISDDKEYKYLSLILIGPTRAGKSTLIQNLTRDAIKNGECVVIFDFIKNCELSEEVASIFPSDKILRIECNDFNKIQGLGYNEVGFDIDPFKQYDNAKKQTTQLMSLINTINSEDASLTAKMERYLTSASLVAFINGESIKCVFDILQNHKIRHEQISKVPESQYENIGEYIEYLYTLDEYDTKTGNLVGTKYNLIAGIIDRLNKLKANTYIELMLKKDLKGNINLVDEMQKNQLICLKMPEDMFSTDNERDIYTTYWITKLWLALQIRAKKLAREKQTKVNLVIDEIYQVNNTEKFLTEKLSRLAKFNIKPIISCHYINQLKYMRNELRSANASYMLISGCDKNNYNEFREELYPFELNDLLNLPRFHSLNIIKYSEGYAKFITKLPKPILERKGEN